LPTKVVDPCCQHPCRLCVFRRAVCYVLTALRSFERSPRTQVTSVTSQATRLQTECLDPRLAQGNVVGPD